MKRNTYDIGIEAESAVAKHYKALGYKEIARRYKTPYGEIDIVLVKNNAIAFIEVKARSYFEHREYITKRQMKRNAAAIEYYISLNQEYVNYMYECSLVVVSNNNIYEIIENYLS